MNGIGGLPSGLYPLARDTARSRPSVPAGRGDENAVVDVGATPADRDRQARAIGQPIEESVEAARSGLSAGQRVSATLESESARFRRQPGFEELPLDRQRALAAYASNQANGFTGAATSELVGVDIFV